MRRLAAVLSVAAFVLLPSCSSDEITTAPDQGSEAGATNTAMEATVGDTISLHGAVTVLSVVDPAKGDLFLKAEEGSRYVAVETRLENTGPINYSDSPTNGAVLTDVNSHVDRPRDRADARRIGPDRSRG
jgi:hypothetical protein